MTANKSIVPDGKDTFSDDDWATATEQVRATRDRVLAEHPAAAAAAERVYGEIAGRVHTLAAIRRARGLTQQQISTQLNISQAEVSRFERRSNLHLDTLARFIEATGGKLRITAVFDDTEVEVGIGDLLGAEPSYTSDAGVGVHRIEGGPPSA